MNDNLFLLKKLKNGDPSALETLISENYGLIRKVALRFTGRSVEYDDLCQIASIGMIRAARDFDFSFNTSFSTYAVPLMIGEIRKYLRDDGLIKVSRSIKKNGMTLRAAREEFVRKNSREPSLSELSSATGLSDEEIIESYDAASPALSLQAPVEDGSGTMLEAFICDRENLIEKLTEREALKEEIKKLSPLHKKILCLRYQKELSQQKTGEILGMSQVRISREEKKIMEILKKAL